MASEDTKLGNEIRLQLGDGNSPEVFIDFCTVTDVQGLGESKPQVDVTGACDISRRFRNGLAEGNEMTLVANFIQGDTQVQALYELYKTDDIANFRYVVNPGDSPSEYFAFSLTLLSWALATPIGDKATMTFGGKITGPVVWLHA